MDRFPCSNCKKECLSEFVGTYLLILIGPGTIIALSLYQSLGPLTSLSIIALAFGGTVGVLILLLGESSAQINPAVTLAHVLARLTRQGLLIPFVVFQILGGLLAGLTLRFAFGSSGGTTSFGSTKLASGLDPTTGIILEMLGTAVLSFSALVATSRIQSHKFQALTVGTTLVFLILILGSLTGASFNPARSLGPSVASGYSVDWYVYWIGPLLGGAVGALIFKLAGKLGGNSRGRGELPVCLC